jgi:hypothetical protein
MVELDLCHNGFASEPAERFSALTASTGIKWLVVVEQDIYVLPNGITRHMFPPGRQLQQLTHVTLVLEEWDPDGPDGGFMSGSELRCLIDACPALQFLDMTNTLHEPATVPELLRLPQCCNTLCVGGRAFSDEAAHIVAQLTQLTRLRWQDDQDVGSPSHIGQASGAVTQHAFFFLPRHCNCQVV